MSKIVNITESAEKYLAKLIEDKNEPNLAVRILSLIQEPQKPKPALHIVNQKKQ